MEEPKENYLHIDSPINSPDQDVFKRDGLAQQIAHVIKTQPLNKGFITGILSQWGAGKSSLLGLVKYHLKDDESIIIQNFNPWQYQDEKNLLIAFFGVLYGALDKSLKSGKEELAEKIAKYGSLLGSVTQFVGVGTDGIADFAKRIAEVSVEEKYDELKDILNSSDKRILIIIDDLDRLDKDEIFTIIKLVKSCADFPNVFYLLAFDEYYVSESLEQKLAGSGKDFLEKIIQLPIKLPLIPKAKILQFLYDQLNRSLRINSVDINEEDNRRLNNFIDTLVVPSLTNPRLPFRVANAVQFIIPMLRSEINYADIICIEFLKLLHPNVYDYVKSNSQLFVSGHQKVIDFAKETNKEVVESKVKEMFKDEDVANRVLMGLKILFPDLPNFNSGFEFTSETTEDIINSLRVASIWHFDRYFTYNVHEGELSEAVFYNLISSLGKNEDSSFKIAVEIIKEVGVSDLVTRLQIALSSIDLNKKIQVANLLARLGEYIADSTSFFDLSDAGLQSKFVIGKIAEEVKTEERFKLFNHLISIASPTSFSTRMYQEASRKNSEGKLLYITEKECDKLATQLVRRINTEYSLPEVLNSFHEDEINIYFAAWLKSEPKVLRKNLVKCLVQNPELTIKLIKVYVPTSYSTSNPKPHKGSYPKSWYDHIRNFIDIDLLYKLSVTEFGEVQRSPVDTGRLSKELSDEDIIGIFQHYYKQDQEEKKR